MAQRKNSGRTHQRAGRANRNASATKAGPGRFHEQGHEKSNAPKQRGTPFGFELHKASPAKKHRRQLVKQVGRRQAIKLQKTERALARQWATDPAHDYVEAPAEA